MFELFIDYFCLLQCVKVSLYEVKTSKEEDKIKKVHNYLLLVDKIFLTKLMYTSALFEYARG